MNLYKKLTKNQLKGLLKERDTLVELLEQQVRDLKGDLEEEKNKIITTEQELLEFTMREEVIINPDDEEKITFYRERIKNCIHKDLVRVFKKELNRILNKY